MSAGKNLPQTTRPRFRPPRAASLPGQPERVIWLECGGHRIPALLGHLESSLDQHEAVGSLVVVLDQLERLEGSVTGFIHELFALAQEWSLETTVVDPSGLAAALAEILSE